MIDFKKYPEEFGVCVRTIQEFDELVYELHGQNIHDNFSSSTSYDGIPTNDINDRGIVLYFQCGGYDGWDYADDMLNEEWPTYSLEEFLSIADDPQDDFSNADIDDFFL